MKCLHCVHRGAAVRAALLVMAALSPRAIAHTSAAGPAFADVMRRAHEYSVTYLDHELSTVIARERYQQQWLDARASIKVERLLVSDFLLFQRPPDENWYALRDVHEVDGMPVADHAARLKELFGRPRDSNDALGLEIMKESGRFNLAPDLYYRTINVPTFALLFLRPANRSRIEFTKTGEEPVEGIDSWIVGFRETKGPTIVGTPDGHQLRTHGRFWVEPQTGAVMRSEMIVGGTRRQSGRVTVTVTYRYDPALGFRVPIEMREWYDNPRHREDDVVDARATYSEFRRFDSRTLFKQP